MRISRGAEGCEILALDEDVAGGVLALACDENQRAAQSSPVNLAVGDSRRDDGAELGEAILARRDQVTQRHGRQTVAKGRVSQDEVIICINFTAALGMGAWVFDS